jgi:hypothetical protein
VLEQARAADNLSKGMQIHFGSKYKSLEKLTNLELKGFLYLHHRQVPLSHY